MLSTLRKLPGLVPPRVWLVLLTCACLAPFADKAFHIDDTLFLRAAEQIQKHPFDFYGFSINWFNGTTPMIEAFVNPPLVSYFIALVARVAGWSEVALHLAFLLPAIAAVLGTYSLAGRFCGRPLLAAVSSLLTPVFLISGTSVMCDMMLVAFWVWAVSLFDQGLRRGSVGLFIASGCLAGLAVLTKFSGLALVPLLGAYGIYKLRRPGWWLLTPLIPVLFAAGYEGLTRRIYGHGLLLFASSYATTFRAAIPGSAWEKLILGNAFMGGCFLPALFYALWLWSRRVLLAGICLIGVCLIVLPYMAGLATLLWGAQGGLNWEMFFQCALFTIGGIHILALAMADCWSRRDGWPLLLLWVLGVAVFAVRMNWTITARSFLPLAPALGILTARRMECNRGALTKSNRQFLVWPALAAAIFSLPLVKADYDLANTGRRAARLLADRYVKPGQTLWFKGHWGFQYYMENLGARLVDAGQSEMKRGDVVVYPNHNSNVGTPDMSAVTLVNTLTYFPNAHIATMNPAVGAGFYAAVMGPLPFAWGRIEPERYLVYEVK